MPGIEWAIFKFTCAKFGGNAGKAPGTRSCCKLGSPTGNITVGSLEGKAAVEEPAPGLRRHSPGRSRATAEAGCPRWLYAI